MAVNKNFVVKNGLEVNDNLLVADVDTQKVGIGTSVSSYELHVLGGVGATDLHVTGVTTLSNRVLANDSVVISNGLLVTGITTLASAGGITTTGGDFYVGGDLYVLDDIVYDEVTGRNISITGVSTFVGVGTFNSDLYVGGNLNVLGDIVYDEVTGRNLNITGISSLATVDIGAGDISVSYLNVSGVATLPAAISMTNINVTGIGTIGIASISDAVVSGAATFNNDITVLGDLNVTGDLSYDEVTGRNLNITGIATIATLVGYSSEFSGAIGCSSQTSATDSSTLVGAAITTINFIGGGATAYTSADSRTLNVTLPPAGASIGLAIALGG